jgi:hypothetical protein
MHAVNLLCDYVICNAGNIIYYENIITVPWHRTKLWGYAVHVVCAGLHNSLEKSWL